MDNLPARRNENNSPRRQPSSLRFHSDGFYSRNSIEDTPVVFNRRIKLSSHCKICRLVPKLMEEHGYSFEEATDVEQDLYRFIYTFWSPEEISRWLRKVHEYDAAHDSVYRHINQHVPDPNVAILDRVRSYRPDFMNKKFFLSLADTMKLSLMKFQGRMASGDVQISPQEFLAIAKLLQEWQEFLGELKEDKTDLLMQAVGNAIENTLNPYPEIKEIFLNNFRQELEKVEREEYE